MDLETRRKISRSMKGKSNFEGKKHTHATKIQIGISQEGHRNAKDHKWVTDKESGQEHRVKGDKPKGTRWGRTRRFQQWIHTKEETMKVWEKPNPVTKSEKLSSSQKARAKARAKAAGRPYPNMVDNIWAARNEEVVEAKATPCGRCGTTHVAPKFGGKCPALKEDASSAKRLIGTSSLRKIYTKATPGQSMKCEGTIPFEGPYEKVPSTVKDKSGAVHTPMSRARHLARMALKVKELKKTKDVKESRAITSFRTSGKSNSMQAWLGAHKTCPECRGQKPAGPFKIVKGVADNKPICKDCQDETSNS